MRSRLPHPATEGDAWIWEEAESIYRLQVVPCDKWRSQIKMPNIGRLQIDTREGIRDILRSFKNTASFIHPSSQNVLQGDFVPLAILYANKMADSPAYSFGHDQRGDYFFVLNGSKHGWGNGQYRNTGQHHGIASVNAASAERFRRALGIAVGKARRGEEGYAISNSIPFNGSD